MRRVLSAMVGVALLVAPTATSALCQVSMLDHASYCEAGSEGTCCIVEYADQGMSCLDIWCHDYDGCRWERAMGPLCG